MMAYRPKGASSYAQSKLNLVDSSTYPLTEMYGAEYAPIFDTNYGWSTNIPILGSMCSLITDSFTYNLYDEGCLLMHIILQTSASDIMASSLMMTMGVQNLLGFAGISREETVFFKGNVADASSQQYLYPSYFTGNSIVYAINGDDYYVNKTLITTNSIKPTNQAGATILRINASNPTYSGIWFSAIAFYNRKLTETELFAVQTVLFNT